MGTGEGDVEGTAEGVIVGVNVGIGILVGASEGLLVGGCVGKKKVTWPVDDSDFSLSVVLFLSRSGQVWLGTPTKSLSWSSIHKPSSMRSVISVGNVPLNELDEMSMEVKLCSSPISEGTSPVK